MQVLASSLFSGALVARSVAAEASAFAAVDADLRSTDSRPPHETLPGPAMTPPLASRLWQPDPTDFWDPGHLLRLVRPEAPETQAAAIRRFLDAFRGEPHRLTRILGFLDCNDWQKIPYRRLQTLDEALGMAVASEATYSHLGIFLEETFHPAYGYMAPDVSRIRRESIEPPLAIELWPGVGEAHGGLDLRLSVGRRFVGKIGFLIGPETLHVVQVKGGPAFQPHQRRLRELFGETHPFDWLLQSLASSAAATGFRHLRGYGYRHNSWIQKDFNDGLFPAERHAHFEKVYDRRFADFGMEPVPDLPDVYEIGI